MKRDSRRPARAASGSPAPRCAPVRQVAVEVLAQVLGAGGSLSQLLPAALPRTAQRDRALLAELCYGTLRWYPQLQALLGRLLERPLRCGEHAVEALLLLGLYQLLHLRIPDYAAVAESVATARRLGKPWAAGLVNGVLRAFLRRREALLAELGGDPQALHAHPRWLLARLQADWPEHWQDMVAAGNRHPPLTLRVNRRRSSRADYLAELTAAGIEAQAVAAAEDAVTLVVPCEVADLPGFAAGRVSVQDAAAQLAVGLLELAPGQRVLDACAAPGGKSCHILEREPGLAELVALDIDSTRLARVAENLARLGLSATLLAGDGLRPEQWWDGRPFDRILLDAPCSATGVIRRHPDIKLLRQEADIARLSATQRTLLERLWPLLRPGGVLLYATCSVLRQENEQVVADFLTAHPEAREQPIAATWGLPRPYGRQILSGMHGMDGFYYACLRKAGEGGDA
ncbi:MAG TPA: 16S rRNA (cytosine(967)-C(5))-methyltransferase RsmB [Candidatus Competibacteraceae bacterium]|nr:16S rRNA (cytosine(967)-C(5))-methyltransferase RsmB [Candidatus Competibacteraceae bacterium]